MPKPLSLKFEEAVRLLAKHLPVSDASSRKPILFHNVRVGVYLYKHKYSEEVVLAGLLHDAIEWSSLTEQMLLDRFNDKVVKLILASTQDDSITDKNKRTAELIKRCISNGQDALIVKTADIIDSFKWYASQDNKDELSYCMRNANAILRYKPDDFDDKIFDDLKDWRKRFSNLDE